MRNGQDAQILISEFERRFCILLLPISTRLRRAKEFIFCSRDVYIAAGNNVYNRPHEGRPTGEFTDFPIRQSVRVRLYMYIVYKSFVPRINALSATTKHRVGV